MKSSLFCVKKQIYLNAKRVVFASVIKDELNVFKFYFGGDVNLCVIILSFLDTVLLLCDDSVLPK